MLYFIMSTDGSKVEEVTTSHPTESLPGVARTWLCRVDFKTWQAAADMAKLANESLGTMEGLEFYIPTDAGSHCSPQFDVIERPTVGSLVSRYFNGDGYPAGKIVKVSGLNYRRVETSDGTVFWRRHRSGSWVSDQTWSMVGGVVNDRNPSF